MSVRELQDALDAAGVVHFSAYELVRCPKPDVARRVGVSLVEGCFALPPAMLPGCVAVALVADKLRQGLRAPLVVRSGYRPTKYNSAVGGAPGSQHRNGCALDLYPSTTGLLPALRVLALDSWIDAHLGGLGLYLGNIHIDTRAKPVAWGSQLTSQFSNWIARGGTMTREIFNRVALNERRLLTVRGIVPR